MIYREQLLKMKKDALIIKPSRGSIINVDHLYNARTEGYFLGTAINVFENEPNTGKLVGKDPLLLKAHMGSMSIDCRSQM